MRSVGEIDGREKRNVGSEEGKARKTKGMKQR